MRSAVIERLGEQALPPGSNIVDWPISYDDLEPYYDRVEYVMGVFWNAPIAPPYNISTHEVGITRLGEDPATSVANTYGQSHELTNLFILGGGLFPTYGGYNPTETIQALTFMLADYIKKEVRGAGSLAR
jgi:choline dehydrogenase-like flavoprotein